MANATASDVLGLTAKIVAAHVSKNHLAVDEISLLIHRVYQSLSSAGAATTEHLKRPPAVPIKKSVFPEYIVCLEDGKQMKMLKRHLHTFYHMTPEQYRERWELPSDYPMVAPNYAAHRSALAREVGLGQKMVAKPTVVKPPRATGKSAKKVESRLSNPKVVAQA